MDSGKLFFSSEEEFGFPLSNYFLDKHRIVPHVYNSNDAVSGQFEKDLLSLLKTLHKKIEAELIWEAHSVKNGIGQIHRRIYKYGDSLYISLVNNVNADSYYFEPDQDEKSWYDILYEPIEFNIKCIEKIIDIAIKNLYSTKNTGKIFLLKKSDASLYTVPFRIKKQEVDVKLNYGSSFEKKYDKIIERLNHDFSKGLVLFHGDPGCGKTALIKHICSSVNKKVIFVPPFLIDEISDPSFIPFLLKHTNSILVVEDAEKVVTDRNNTHSSQGVSNILNLTDGILSDCLNIQVIATFNMSRDNIDKALLRKGRLIAEHQFSPLSADDSNILLKHIGKDKTTTKPLTLAEIYSIDEEDFSLNSEKGKMGFQI